MIELICMNTDILIIGQGICGSFLSHYLEKAGLSFIVIDEEQAGSASRAAAGIINPVTGRRIVTTWKIGELLPFAMKAYRALESELGASFFSVTEMVEFFPSAQMRNAFTDRIAAGFEHGEGYLRIPDRQTPGAEDGWRDWFRYDLGYGTISPCCLIDLVGLLKAARARLQAKGNLLEERFEPAALAITGPGGGVIYKDITARQIIFCEGAGGFGNPYFSRLPFAPNKGEALIVEIPGLPAGPIYKKGMVLAPWQDGLYWLGSSYEWSFADDRPTAGFLERGRTVLEEWLRIPFRIVDHIAAVRPATLERRPFVGFHPQHEQVGILNGMGTKGCSLAPWFASELALHIAQGSPILPEANVNRFARVLARG